jgi:hypothetical protein
MNLAKSYHSLSRFCGEHLLRKIINKVSKTTIKWIIGIALLSIQTIAHSQNFIDETKQWAILSNQCTDGPPCYFTYFYKFIGDSTFNGKIYHKLYESPDSNQTNWHLNSIWREKNDSVFNCIYFSSMDTILPESLVYDFNIQEGDSFFVNSGSFYMKVDSIRFLDWGGSIRKHWFFCKTNSDCSPMYRTIWIEGVGQTGYFPHSSDIGWIGAINQLLCFQENGNLVYQNPNFNSCYVQVPTNTKSQELINLFPNPATTQLTLTLPANTANAIYTLYDMQGRLQLTGKTNNTQVELNVATLPRGLYVLKIITEKEIITKKVVLQ